MDLKSKIQSLATDYANDTISIRRHLHSNPELSFEEHNTMKFVTKQLKELDLVPTEGVAGTGVVALIHGKNPESKTIALRADLDALPIQEKNEIEYKSKVAGVMHACGHDVHTASLLGAARILTNLKDQFEGTIKLIFQPGEEKTPGGASLMIKAGVLQNPSPERIIGQHVMPQIPVGKVGFREGMYMASADEIYVTVKGKGGHGAMPDFNVDPVIISAHILVALQQIVSRYANPKVPCVLSFGKVMAEGATNVIPDQVYMEGTFRTMDEKWRADAHIKMKKMAEGIAESMGATCDFNIVKGYPFLVNEPVLTKRLKQLAKDYMGAENVVDLDLWMAAEDFSYYSQEIDACFYRLGVRNEEKGIISSVHTPTFNIDESALEIGTGLMAWLAVNELQKT
ncbi:MAG TPA: M20 family metallopeptidase [Cytophagales bacterium]|nr:M20 family metallopeptidase [Cytophagales bacterium]